MAVDETLVRATQTITLDNATKATTGETIVIGGKTYTFNATVGTADGSVHIGAAVADTVDNLVAAINLDPTEGETGTEGTDYGSSMTRNGSVYATRVAATGVITLHSHIPGTIGNHIPVAQGTSAITLGGTALSGGTGNVGDYFDGVVLLNQLNSEVVSALRPFTVQSGGKLD